MFDVHASIADEYEIDDVLLAKYIKGLMEEFINSPEGEAFLEESDDQVGWAESYMHFLGAHVGKALPEATPHDTSQVIFEIFPSKVSVEASEAPNIIGEMRAFWQFLKREYALENADSNLELFGPDSVAELEDKLSDPNNFNIAKSIFKLGQEAGFDMTSEEDIQEFMLLYNANMIGGNVYGFSQSPQVEVERIDHEPEFSRPQPIMKTTKRVGRNDACPCGSGRKFKKCCINKNRF